MDSCDYFYANVAKFHIVILDAIAWLIIPNCTPKTDNTEFFSLIKDIIENYVAAIVALV